MIIIIIISTLRSIIIYFNIEKYYALRMTSVWQVVRSTALTHWATTLDVSPLGHLIAIGTAGELTF